MTRVFFLTLIAALVLLTGLASVPAWSDAVSPRMSLEGPTDQCFAVVVIQNTVGIYNRHETLATDLGAVVVNYQTVGGHNAIDADLVQVVALPDGVAAVPMHMALPDGQTGRICLIEWIGG